MKKDALEYLERVKETTQKSHYVPHGWGIDDMMVRESYDVQSVPYDKAVYAVEIANKGMTARPKPEWIDYKKQKPPYGEEVLAYHHLWVREDSTPDGIRVGFRSEGVVDDNDDFISSYWWNYQECYVTISRFEVKDNLSFDQKLLECIEPEYWMKKPKFSKRK